jgi:hypothetical protein
MIVWERGDRGAPEGSGAPLSFAVWRALERVSVGRDGVAGLYFAPCLTQLAARP